MKWRRWIERLAGISRVDGLDYKLAKIEWEVACQDVCDATARGDTRAVHMARCDARVALGRMLEIETEVSR